MMIGITDTRDSPSITWAVNEPSPSGPKPKNSGVGRNARIGGNNMGIRN